MNLRTTPLLTQGSAPAPGAVSGALAGNIVNLTRSIQPYDQPAGRRLERPRAGVLPCDYATSRRLLHEPCPVTPTFPWARSPRLEKRRYKAKRDSCCQCVRKSERRLSMNLTTRIRRGKPRRGDPFIARKDHLFLFLFFGGANLD